MKTKDTLIRLHTDNERAIFDCNFSDDIVVEKEGQLALQSLSMERNDAAIFVDHVNDRIDFQFTPARPLIARIHHGQFNKTTAKARFRSITDAMNGELRQSNPVDGTQNQSEVGGQCRVFVNKTNKVVFEMKNSGALPLLITNSDAIAKDITSTGSQSFGKFNRTLATSSILLNDSYFAQQLPICMGLGYFHAQISRFSADANTGFILGLTQDINKINAQTITEADLDFGVRIRTLGGIIEVKTEKSGNFADNAGNIVFDAGDIFTANSANNSYLGFRVQTDAGVKKVHINKYSNPANNGEFVEERLATADIAIRDADDPSKDLNYFPILGMFGGTDVVNHCRIQRVRMATNPFYNGGTGFFLNKKMEARRQVLTNQVLDSTTEALAAIPQANRRATNKQVSLAASVATFFGYTNANLRGTDTTSIEDFQVVSIRSFENQIVSDNYLVELLNIPIKAYDSFNSNDPQMNGGRKNILAVVPFTEAHIDDVTGLIQYEPNEKYYLDLANDSRLLLRNIKARIITSTHEQIDLTGIASLNLLLRNFSD